MTEFRVVKCKEKHNEMRLRTLNLAKLHHKVCVERICWTGPRYIYIFLCIHCMDKRCCKQFDRIFVEESFENLQEFLSPDYMSSNHHTYMSFFKVKLVVSLDGWQNHSIYYQYFLWQEIFTDQIYQYFPWSKYFL